MNKKNALLMSALCLVLGACAQKTGTTTGQDAKEYLDLYMAKYYPDVKANADGIYILDDQPGDGVPWSEGDGYIQADVTIRVVGTGAISATTDEDLAKQLGTYTVGDYYGPKWMATGATYSYAGVDAMLKGMRIGGKRKAIIPSWMLTTSRYSSEEAYIKACTSSSHLEYTIGLAEQCTDIDVMETSQLTSYVIAHYGYGIEPVSYITDQEADGKFYFITDISAFEQAGEKAISSGDTFYINYTGMLLNGQVFDTTLKNVAKDAGIYNASRTYEEVSVVQAATYSDVTMGGSSDLINGFKGALHLLKYKGQKAVVLFTSAHGYSSSGSGSAIPGYAPLIFELEVLDK